MIVGTIKSPMKASDVMMLTKLGFKVKSIKPGTVKIWRER